MAEHDAHLSPQEPPPPAWVKTELARHPQRPDPMSLIENIFTDLSEIHGDRVGLWSKTDSTSYFKDFVISAR